MKYFIYRRKSQEDEDRQVMSLESQTDEIAKLIANDPTIEVVGEYDESRTAKTLGRPLFIEMMDRIDKGEAEGIISWHPDRLARNSMDGGRVIYALDQGTLKDMRFCSYSFANDPQGKFMLNIIFGYSKYYVDNLSINVKRGLQTKLKNGWKPNLAPIGYRNCKETKTIIPDGEQFKAVRGMYDLLLSENRTPSAIHRIVCNDWAYTTPLRKRTGGKKPALSTIYKILANPFYAGFIRWKGQLYAGSHIPIITKTEFNRAQSMLGHIVTTKKKSLSFPYTGLFKCGACGLSITAETKHKPSGRQYTYYHCTRRHSTPYCVQPAINSTQLEEQIVQFLDRISLPQFVTNWLVDNLKDTKQDMAAIHAETAKKAAQNASLLERQLSVLVDLRTREVIADDEFDKKRIKLQIELAAAQENVANVGKQQQGLEPIKILSFLSTRAKYWFSIGDDEMKRKLLSILSYNSKLMDRKALLVAKRPFIEMMEILNFSGCAEAYKLSGLQLSDSTKLTNKQIKKLNRFCREPEIIKLAQEVTLLINQCDPLALSDLKNHACVQVHKNIDTAPIDC